jgi:hypothetical protein
MSIRDATRYLSLSEAIDSLKAELLKARQRAQDLKNPLFQLNECEIELALEFEPQAGLEVNAGLFKVSAGAGVKGGHKVTVRFGPIDGSNIHFLDPRPNLDLAGKDVHI